MSSEKKQEESEEPFCSDHPDADTRMVKRGEGKPDQVKCIKCLLEELTYPGDVRDSNPLSSSNDGNDYSRK